MSWHIFLLDCGYQVGLWSGICYALYAGSIHAARGRGMQSLHLGTIVGLELAGYLCCKFILDWASGGPHIDWGISQPLEQQLPSDEAGLNWCDELDGAEWLNSFVTSAIGRVFSDVVQILSIAYFFKFVPKYLYKYRAWMLYFDICVMRCFLCSLLDHLLIHMAHAHTHTH